MSEVFGAAHGDKEFVVHGGQRITYADFLAEVNGSLGVVGRPGCGQG
ncbi:MAG: hypothetical protein R2716_07680 [Microthrixaceae bacterium]